ncbi:MAG TPA: CopD family protein [Bacteroidia bacterium]|jgi:putative membrane protein|nr:CopD family protein [Bacteroidia bacterium]
MEYILALHIIFIVTWFAGLFYIVRLFIYMTEANDKPEPDKGILQAQYRIMMRRLWYGITWPSAVATFIFGPWLLFGYWSGFLFQAFFILKLCFVFGLALYHLQCHLIFKQLQAGTFKHSSMWLRGFNEVASIILVAIVFIIELKSNQSGMWLAVGLILFAAALYIGMQMYKKSRLKAEEEEKPVAKKQDD